MWVFFGSHLLKATACCDCRTFNLREELSFTWHSLRRLIIGTRHRRQWSTGLSTRWEVRWRGGNRWRDENSPKVCRCMREDDGECVDLLRRLVATGDLRLSLFLRRCSMRDRAEVVMAVSGFHLWRHSQLVQIADKWLGEISAVSDLEKHKRESWWMNEQYLIKMFDWISSNLVMSSLNQFVRIAASPREFPLDSFE